MQVVEKPGEGLSRSYVVSVPVGELTAALETKIAEILPTLKLKGFRPGKVPPAHVRRLYGKGLMSEIAEKALNDGTQKVIADNQLRVASQPELAPVGDMEQVLAGHADLAFNIDLEVMPDFEPCDVSTLSLVRPVYRSSEEEVAAALDEIAAGNRVYEPRKGKAAKAKDGDQVLIDFAGSIDGVAFDGGSAEDAELVIGSGQFIPGFEEQLIGAKAGDALDVNVTFPEDYQVNELKGKAAVFAVTVKEVREPKESGIDDALAVRLGMADLEALKTALRDNLDREFVAASRFKLKRALLDALDTRHDIPLPPKMVKAEFDGIWAQIEKDRADGQMAPEDAGKTDEELTAEYRKIAERRVRLGLVLAEIGRRENVTVTDGEMGEAMRAEAMRYGQQAQQIFDILRNDPNIQAQMRAPLYEEKVVDLIVSRANVTDREVSKEDLLREDDLPEGYGESTESSAKAKPKKAKAKAKASAEPDVAAEPETAAAADLASEAPTEVADAPVAAAKTKASRPKAAKAKSE